MAGRDGWHLLQVKLYAELTSDLRLCAASDSKTSVDGNRRRPTPSSTNGQRSRWLCRRTRSGRRSATRRWPGRSSQRLRPRRSPLWAHQGVFGHRAGWACNGTCTCDHEGCTRTHMTQPTEPSKAATKAERRAKQEQQRAAKTAASAAPPAAKASASKVSKSAAAVKDVPPAAAHAVAATSSNATTPMQVNSSLFMHLDHPGKAPKPKSEKEVHPAIKRLALQWSELEIVGCNARCLSMLTAFKDVRHFQPTSRAGF
jgi:hypothetical protein